MSVVLPARSQAADARRVRAPSSSERLDADLARGLHDARAPPRRSRALAATAARCAATARRASSGSRCSRCCWPSATRSPRSAREPPLLLLDDVMSELDAGAPGAAGGRAAPRGAERRDHDRGRARPRLGARRTSRGSRSHESARPAAARRGARRARAHARAGQRSGRRSGRLGRRRWGPPSRPTRAPSRERGGVLTVACDEAVWAAELELMGPELVDRLEASLGRRAITRAALHKQARKSHD